MDINDELSFEIPDMKDISFALLTASFKYPFLTHELRVQDQVVVPAGEMKENRVEAFKMLSELSERFKPVNQWKKRYG